VRTGASVRKQAQCQRRPLMKVPWWSFDPFCYGKSPVAPGRAMKTNGRMKVPDRSSCGFFARRPASEGGPERKPLPLLSAPRNKTLFLFPWRGGEPGGSPKGERGGGRGRGGKNCTAAGCDGYGSVIALVHDGKRSGRLLPMTGWGGSLFVAHPTTRLLPLGTVTDEPEPKTG